MALSRGARAPILAAGAFLLAGLLLAASLVVVDLSASRASRYSTNIQDTRLVSVVTVAATEGDLLTLDVSNGKPEVFSTVRFLIVRGGEGAQIAGGAEPSRALAQRTIGPGDPCCPEPLRIRAPEGATSVDIVKILTYAESRRPGAGEARAWFDRFVAQAAGDVGGTPVVHDGAAVTAHYALAALGAAVGVAGLAAAAWGVRAGTNGAPGGPREAGVSLVLRAREHVTALRALSLVGLAALFLAGLVIVPLAGSLAEQVGGVGFAGAASALLLVVWLGVVLSWALLAWRTQVASRRWTEALDDAPTFA